MDTRSSLTRLFLVVLSSNHRFLTACFKMISLAKTFLEFPTSEEKAEPAHLAELAEEHFQDHCQRVWRRTDRIFAGLMALQWLAGIGVALWVTPRTWIGATSSLHLHVLAAIFLGGAIAAFPILLVFLRPGQAITRHVIAVSQILTSALLIHLTGGRIETHFHVFGSLAFLAFYRDWRVLVTATVVVALDHFLRGEFWPQSVFGSISCFCFAQSADFNAGRKKKMFASF